MKIRILCKCIKWSLMQTLLRRELYRSLLPKGTVLEYITSYYTVTNSTISSIGDDGLNLFAGL